MSGSQETLREAQSNPKTTTLCEGRVQRRTRLESEARKPAMGSTFEKALQCAVSADLRKKCGRSANYHSKACAGKKCTRHTVPLAAIVQVLMGYIARAQQVKIFILSRPTPLDSFSLLPVLSNQK